MLAFADCCVMKGIIYFVLNLGWNERQTRALLVMIIYYSSTPYVLFPIWYLASEFKITTVGDRSTTCA